MATKPRLTADEHTDLGHTLAGIRDELTHRRTQLLTAYPKTGPQARPASHLAAAVNAIDAARAALENLCTAEHPDTADTTAYYPSPTDRPSARNANRSDNPARVRTFDHTSLGALPEYQVAAQALNALVHAANGAELGIGQDQWLTAVRDLAAAIPFMDSCDHCRDYDRPAAPHAADVDRAGRMLASYRCPTCGHAWTCGWGTSAPNYL